MTVSLAGVRLGGVDRAVLTDTPAPDDEPRLVVELAVAKGLGAIRRSIKKLVRLGLLERTMVSVEKLGWNSYYQRPQPVLDDCPAVRLTSLGLRVCKRFAHELATNGRIVWGKLGDGD